MKKLPLFLFASAMTLVGCMNHDDATSVNIPLDKNAINENAKNIFGEIDPNQDWSSTTQGQVTIKADANLEDIEKIQILTESPFLNDNVKVLNEVAVKNGQTVTLSYDAPNVYDQLVAACVSKSGVYYIQAFDKDQKEVSFASTAQARMTRAIANEAPTLTTLKLKSHASLNALRTKAAQEGQLTINNADKTPIPVDYTDLWKNSNWEDELLWEPVDQTLENANGWQFDYETGKCTGIIYRNISGFGPGEKENIENILNSFFYKYGKDAYSVNGKKNNAKTIRESKVFTTFNNYVETDGVNPVTIIPIQAYSQEFKKDFVYYYYFDPKTAPTSEEEFVKFVKKLPKFKALQVGRALSSDEANNGVIFKRQEFLLPYYGDGDIQEENTASAIFPVGYKIGFLIMKNDGLKYDINKNINGCTYGDGRFNYEVNHIDGHYLSAIDTELGGRCKEGMQWKDPRIAIFSANDKKYMCFEDGADCNYSDLVLEIVGTTTVDEIPTPEAEIYTMCFEDEPESADYDINDVVLRASRVSDTQIKLSLVALGGYDQVMLQGYDGLLTNKELHLLFGIDITTKKEFINTQRNAKVYNPIEEIITVDASVSIKDFLSQISIKNLTTGKTIALSAAGEPPYAIIVPSNFRYPLERISILDAYSKFINWAQNRDTSKDWYVECDEDKVY